MKMFVWERISHCSNNYHDEGGVVVFAETEARARELANVDGCSISLTEAPDDVREVIGGEEKAYWCRTLGAANAPVAT